MAREYDEYSIINHKARKHLNLSMNEYAIADSIYWLSNEGRGICRASKKYLGEFIGISERQVFTIVAMLDEYGLIERDEKGNLRGTNKWKEIVYSEFKINGNGKNSYSTKD